MQKINAENMNMLNIKKYLHLSQKMQKRNTENMNMLNIEK